MSDLFEMYVEQNFTRTEGEAGVRNLENLCNVIGYGEGFMRGRGVEEFLADNPGAVEALLGFIEEWTERNSEWEEAIRENLAQDGLLEDGEAEDEE